MTYFLGIDVGSVSTDFVVIDENNRIVSEQYLKTRGNPIAAIKEGMEYLRVEFGRELSPSLARPAAVGEHLSGLFDASSPAAVPGRAGAINGAGTTGSGRALAAAIVGADVVKNEITAHAVAAAAVNPDVRTVIEIGGQDSKLILMKDGLVHDFAMNTVCAAGTGSFLDRQAERLGLNVNQLGSYAMRADSPVRIAGRCAVFAESDLIHKQQLGCSMENIIAGMCAALARNYLSNVARGKELHPGICFQGGVAANEGIRSAFERELGQEVTVPKYHKVMGAYGAALLAKDKVQSRQGSSVTRFLGFEAHYEDIYSSGFECDGCSNHCEVVLLKSGDKQIGCFQDRCGRYQRNSLQN